MHGGAGDDQYYVDNIADQALENDIDSDGIDRVTTTVDYSLSSNMFTFVVFGGDDIDGTGNGDANTILGNSGANALSGGGGNDFLNGVGGDDTLTGGADADTFDFNGNPGHDIVTDFTKAEGDVLDLSDVLLGFAGAGYTPSVAFSGGFLQFAASGADTLVQVDSDGGGDGFVTIATLLNASLSSGDTANFVL
jgi:serralysin